MRVSAFCLVALAAAIVCTSGCKVRGQRGGVSNFWSGPSRVARRITRSADGVDASIATRGTEECDCYVCRSKRDSEEFVIDQPMDGVDFGDTPVAGELSSPDVEVNQVPDQVILPPSQPVDAESSQPAVLGEIIEGELPENLLPDIDAPESSSSPNENDGAQTVTPWSFNSRASSRHIRSNPAATAPKVESAEIPASRASVNVDQNDGAFRASAFRLNAGPKRAEQPVEKAAKTTVPETLKATEQDEPRDVSIWAAPAVEKTKPASSAKRAAKPYPSIMIQTLPARTEPTPAAPESKAPAAQTAPVSPAVKANEIRGQAITEPIVLQARPVDRHTIYNSLPSHAPVRTAQLPEHLGGRPQSTMPAPSRTPRSLMPQQPSFYQLPPMSERMVEPGSTVVPTPAVAVPLDSAAKLPASTQLRPLPIPSGEAATGANDGTFDPSSDQPFGESAATAEPFARVVQPASPLLTLQARPESNEPALPPIVNIQHEHTVVGSLQVLTAKTAVDPNVSPQPSGIARLHVQPWQPMQVGEEGDRDVRLSIQGLTIRPDSQSDRDTIER